MATKILHGEPSKGPDPTVPGLVSDLDPEENLRHDLILGLLPEGLALSGPEPDLVHAVSEDYKLYGYGADVLVPTASARETVPPVQSRRPQ